MLSLTCCGRDVLPDVCVGLKHGARVAGTVVPITALCAFMVVWPICLCISRGAEDLLRVERRVDEVVAFNPFAWTPDFRQGLRAPGSMYAAVAARESVFASLTFLSFGPFCYTGLRREERHARRWCAGFLAGAVVVAFASGFGFTSAAVSGDVGLGSPALEPVARCALYAVFLSPLTIATMLLPFPVSAYRQAARRIVGVILATVCCYFGWRVICAFYFNINDKLARALVGVLVPHVLGGVAFEVYYPYGCLLLEHRGLPAATLWLATPFAFTVSASAALQHGAPSIAVGIGMELGGLLVELKRKRGMLHGRTPLQENIRFVRLCCRCLGRRRAPSSSSCQDMQDMRIVPSAPAPPDDVPPSPPAPQQ